MPNPPLDGLKRSGWEGATGIRAGSPDRTRDLPDYSENQQPDMIQKLIDLFGPSPADVGGPSEAITKFSLTLGNKAANVAARSVGTQKFLDSAKAMSNKIKGSWLRPGLGDPQIYENAAQLARKAPRTVAHMAIYPDLIPNPPDMPTGRAFTGIPRGRVTSTIPISYTSQGIEEAISNPNRGRGTLWHEGTHGAHALADSKASEKYDLASKIVGYADNPYEVTARNIGSAAEEGKSRPIPLFAKRMEPTRPGGARAMERDRNMNPTRNMSTSMRRIREYTGNVPNTTKTMLQDIVANPPPGADPADVEALGKLMMRGNPTSPLPNPALNGLKRVNVGSQPVDDIADPKGSFRPSTGPKGGYTSLDKKPLPPISGRTGTGEKMTSGKVNPQTVALIRKRFGPKGLDIENPAHMTTAAEEFGIHPRTLRDIIKRDSWNWVK